MAFTTKIGNYLIFLNLVGYTTSVGADRRVRPNHEHIIRNENHLNRIREYITNNPIKWHLDKNDVNIVLKTSSVLYI
jgi:hypothetical protein